MVTHQLQVERRTAKERWPETGVLPLSHADQPRNIRKGYRQKQIQQFYASSSSSPGQNVVEKGVRSLFVYRERTGLRHMTNARADMHAYCNCTEGLIKVKSSQVVTYIERVLIRRTLYNTEIMRVCLALCLSISVTFVIFVKIVKRNSCYTKVIRGRSGYLHCFVLS